MFKQIIQIDFKLTNINSTSVFDLISDNKIHSKIEELNKINVNEDNFEVSSKNNQNRNIIERAKNILKQNEINKLNEIIQKKEDKKIRKKKKKTKIHK
jgi:hypothetical protein